MPVPIKVKSPREILDKLRTLTHNHQKRYFKKHLYPSPVNCKGAPVHGADVSPCSKCKAIEGQPCQAREQFAPRFTKAELSQMFRDDIKNHQKLLREYRDVAMLLWCLGQFDQPQDPSVQTQTVDDPLVRTHSEASITIHSVDEARELVSVLMRALKDFEDAHPVTVVERRATSDGGTGDPVPEAATPGQI